MTTPATTPATTAATTTSATSTATTTAWIIAGVWAFVCSIVSAALLAFHLAALPAPRVEDAALQAAIARHARDDVERRTWRMIHVLYQRCRCSRNVVDHLVARAHPAGVVERVVLVDGDEATTAALTHAGYAVDVVTPDALHADWHIEAAPLLLVVDDTGAIRYAGGYTTQKQGPVIEDLTLFAKAHAGESLRALPLFGCATSRALQRAVDPLSLKTLLAWRPFADDAAAGSGRNAR